MGSGGKGKDGRVVLGQIWVLRTVIEFVRCVRGVGFDASKVKVLGRGAETVGRVGAGEVLGGA